MKKIVLLIFFMCATSLYAQQEPPSLYLEYDKAGNQIVSDLRCVNCPEDEVEKQHLDALTYHPNPLKETLHIRWENTETAHVTTVRVYSLSGKQVASKNHLDTETELNLNFGDKSAGIYIVEVLSSDGTTKSFKIIKK